MVRLNPRLRHFIIFLNGLQLLPSEVYTKPVAAEDLSIISHEANGGGPFEGPEKLLEVWFTPTKDVLNNHPTRGTRLELAGHDFGSKQLTGLRTISLDTWKVKLDLVNCKVLSIIEGQEVDAYLLSESSMFMLEIARDHCGFPGVWQLFYSRKTYMFPERQKGPHKTWEQETGFLDKFFVDSSSYTVGQTSRDHWYLYLTSPRHHVWTPKPTVGELMSLTPRPEAYANFPELWRQRAVERDVTLEILMTGLSPKASQQFYINEPHHPLAEGSIAGNKLATKLKIDASSLIGSGHTDGYLLSPCGFSANMVGGSDKQRYATIHVTPEPTHSFASFESNVDYSDPKENLQEVLTRIVNVFEPKRMSITLFHSHVTFKPSDVELLDNHLPLGYSVVDRSKYKFPDYDLSFLSFERPDHPIP